jgi:hypothetical protein
MRFSIIGLLCVIATAAAVPIDVKPDGISIQSRQNGGAEGLSASAAAYARSLYVLLLDDELFNRIFGSGLAVGTAGQPTGGTGAQISARQADPVGVKVSFFKGIKAV